MKLYNILAQNRFELKLVKKADIQQWLSDNVDFTYILNIKILLLFFSAACPVGSLTTASDVNRLIIPKVQWR